MCGVFSWQGCVMGYKKQLINSSPPSAEYMSYNWVSIASGNSLSPVRCQAITWTNANFLLITPLGANFREIFIKIQNFSLIKMHLKICLWNASHFLQREMSKSYVPICGYFNYMLSMLKTNDNKRLYYTWPPPSVVPNSTSAYLHKWVIMGKVPNVSCSSWCNKNNIITAILLLTHFEKTTNYRHCSEIETFVSFIHMIM